MVPGCFFLTNSNLEIALDTLYRTFSLEVNLQHLKYFRKVFLFQCVITHHSEDWDLQASHKTMNQLLLSLTENLTKILPGFLPRSCKDS